MLQLYLSLPCQDYKTIGKQEDTKDTKLRINFPNKIFQHSF